MRSEISLCDDLGARDICNPVGSTAGCMPQTIFMPGPDISWTVVRKYDLSSHRMALEYWASSNTRIAALATPYKDAVLDCARRSKFAYLCRLAPGAHPRSARLPAPRESTASAAVVGTLHKLSVPSAPGPRTPQRRLAQVAQVVGVVDLAREQIEVPRNGVATAWQEV
jgi:hypothetical protein